LKNDGYLSVKRALSRKKDLKVTRKIADCKYINIIIIKTDKN